ncbi:PREDICTED: uncharacterized protein LOC108760488 [Trachymyrmex cornetzi]|nr:PREDICTED: uncharacterized protein LOC108760488 [Trachymyrmex cornetzi]
MRMKIAWLPALIFCATLALVAANLDLGPIIKLAQCRSSCLRHHMIAGNCLNINNINRRMYDCDLCWNTCEIFRFWDKEEINCTRIHMHTSRIQGCKTAYTFYQTRGTEEDKYEPTKLPAPEENKTFHINNYDIAVIMQKNEKGVWEEENYFYAKQQPALIPGGWIIVVTDDGVVKHYSWDKWWPKLQLLKAGGPLYQAYITWEDWQIQLKDQRERITSNYFKRQSVKEKQYKSSFVVTWQQETGDGIMGNQVTDSESAQISLPCGKYLVRIATNDGPGSYPIVVDTGDCKSPKISIWDLYKYINDPKILIFIFFMVGLFCSIPIIYLFRQNRIKNGKKSKMEEGLTKSEKIKEKVLKQQLQNKLMDRVQTSLEHRHHSHTTDNLLWVNETNMNVNTSIKAQDANASTQNTKCEKANVIQKS